MVKRLALGAAVLVVLAVTLTATAPHPLVAGPIPASAVPGDPSHDYPFFSRADEVQRVGYVEEEFFLQGTAARYAFPGPPAYATIVDGGHAYTTRIIVRRPASPEHFSGTVVMEMQNGANSQEWDMLWAASREHFVRRGHAWIGVSVINAGVAPAPGKGLKGWSPLRYGALNLTDGGTIPGDVLAYDIFSQAAEAVRHPEGFVDPMGGLPVRWIIAASTTQHLVTYHNSIHPLVGVFDAFLKVLFHGNFRTDLQTPVFQLATEFDVAKPSYARQASSDRFQRWEVAGTAPHDAHIQEETQPLMIRDGLATGSLVCTLPPFSRVPMFFVLNAALDHLIGWLEDGVPPPGAPDIARSGNLIQRDGYGNALGGIRLAEHEVATATNSGVNGPATNSCSTFGWFKPFDAATLALLYRNHGAFVNQTTRQAHDTVKDGFIVQDDAITTIQRAAQSTFGK